MENPEPRRKVKLRISELTEPIRLIAPKPKYYWAIERKEIGPNLLKNFKNDYDRNLWIKENKDDRESILGSSKLVQRVRRDYEIKGLYEIPWQD